MYHKGHNWDRALMMACENFYICLCQITRGSVSQNVDLGPGYFSMLSRNSRKISYKSMHINLQISFSPILSLP